MLEAVLQLNEVLLVLRSQICGKVAVIGQKCKVAQNSQGLAVIVVIATLWKELEISVLTGCITHTKSKMPPSAFWVTSVSRLQLTVIVKLIC